MPTASVKEGIQSQVWLIPKLLAAWNICGYRKGRQKPGPPSQGSPGCPQYPARLQRLPFAHLSSLTCCPTFPLAKLRGCSRSLVDQRLVGASDAMDMVTARHTKHEGRTPGTGNGHQLHRQSPHLSWNLQDWPHIWSQVLGPAQAWTEKPRGDFSFSHRTSAGRSWRDHLVQNLHFVDQETAAQERQGPGVVGRWALYKERPHLGFPVAGDTTASFHWNDTRSGLFSSPGSLSVPWNARPQCF